MEEINNNVYKGDITEFVDWITGIDELSGVNVTDGLPVSGGSIRKLLLEKAKKGITMYYDQAKGYYRGFSSDYALEKWLSDPITYADLLLFYFVAPSPYSLNVEGLPSETKYIEKASLSTDGKINFRWLVDSSNEENIECSISVVYRIGGIVRDTQRYSSNQHNITYDLSPYLNSGINDVSITFNAVEVNASTSKSLTIQVVQLDLTSDFSFYLVIDKINDLTINVPYTLSGSDGYNRYISYALDGEIKGRTIISDTASFSINGRILIPTVSLESGKHTLLIFADVTIDNILYYSELLYWEFMVSGLEDQGYMTSLLKASFVGLKNNIFTESNPVYFNTFQYETTNIEWAFYTSHPTIDTQIITWKLKYYTEDENGLLTIENYQVLSITQESRNQPASTLSFFPEIYTNNGHLIAYVKDLEILNSQYKIIVNKSSNDIHETEGYIFKLSGKGKNNNMPENERNIWNYYYDFFGITYTTTFENVLWDNTSGWLNNSLVLSEGAKALVHFNPLSNNPILGTLNYNNADPIQGRTFEIDFETFNVEDSSSNVVLIGNPLSASIQITPNSAIVTDSSGNTVIKTNFKENEKVRLSFIFNKNNSSDTYINNKVFIVNNGILERGASLNGDFGITELILNGKILNGIFLDGSINGIKIYSMKCYPNSITYDNAFYNYVIESGKISELLRKNNVYLNGVIDEQLCEDKLDVILMTGDVESVLNDTSTDKQVSKPVLLQRICRENSKFNFTAVNCRLRKHGQSTLNYAVPSFKIWTDYYDGKDGALTEDGLLSALYNVSDITNMSDEELNMHKVYKGRYQMKDGAIPSKKFVLQANYADSSGVHNGGIERLIQDTWFNAQIDGDYKLRTEPLQFSTSTGDFKNKGFQEATGQAFPITIRVSPDSFPCVIFYRATSTDAYNFLGQYVFMDDKKADHIYGERSIYKVASDPFCLTELFKSYDKKEYRIWDNSKVRRYEIILLNNAFVNYTSTLMGDRNWDDIITNPTDGSWLFAWNLSIELIYPDPDDLIKGITSKFEQQIILRESARPFTEWVLWLASTYADYQRTGNYNKFRSEAKDHLDLYKLAAYYIFCLRFGLVDSMLRNALVKTYDCQHWHYEPWDMDIAMGSRNTGGIAYNPPITRLTSTLEDLTGEDAEGLNNYALSGHDCWLWNALENWTTENGVDGWIDRIVPKTAQALYLAGLTYDNAIHMFDENYQNKWCERLYNDSGYFKYLLEGNGSYLRFLNGARTTHRHWWLKTSFDYWDSKWSCGEFITKHVGMQVDAPRWAKAGYTGYDPGHSIRITAAALSYFSVSQESTLMSSDLVNKGETVDLVYADYDFANMSTKQFNFINGAVNISGLDVSNITELMEAIDIKGCYDQALGLSSLKYLNIGMPWEGMVNYGIFHTKTDGLGIDITGASFNRLEELNILGMYVNTLFNDFLRSLTSLKVFKAAGSNITTMYASSMGNKYTLLQLPDTITTLSLNNSSWQTLEFYTKENGKLVGTPTTRIPDTLNSVQFNGTTGGLNCSKEFVLKWINEIEDFSNKSLQCNNINWNNISYEDILLLSNLLLNPNTSLGGYIMLSSGALGTDDITRATRLQNIRQLFGLNVFTLENSGLKIDYAYDMLAIVADNTAIIENDNIVLYEGSQCQLKATQFHLVNESSTIYDWYLMVNEVYVGSNTSILGCVISSNGLLTINESTFNERDITVVAMSLDGINLGSINLKIKKRNYPVSLKITQESLLFNDTNNTFTVTLGAYYTFKIEPKYSTESYYGSVEEYLWSNMVESRFNVIETTSSYITLEIHDLLSLSEIYTLSYTAKYKDTRIIRSVSVNLNLISNTAILRLSFTPEKYDMLVNGAGLIPATVNTIYSSDLANLKDPLDLSGYSLKNSINNFEGWMNGLHILDYTTSIKTLNLSGFNELTDLNFGLSNWYLNINLSECNKLLLVNLSNLNNLKSLNTVNTSITVSLPNENSKLLNVQLGAPKNLTLNDCPNLNVDSFIINPIKLTNLKLLNTGSKTFTLAANILKVLDDIRTGEGTISITSNFNENLTTVPNTIQFNSSCDNKYWFVIEDKYSLVSNITLSGLVSINLNNILYDKYQNIKIGVLNLITKEWGSLEICVNLGSILRLYDYLEFNGDAYFNSEFKHSISDSKIIAEFTPSSTNSNTYGLFGSRTNNNNLDLWYFYSKVGNLPTISYHNGSINIGNSSTLVSPNRYKVILSRYTASLYLLEDDNEVEILTVTIGGTSAISTLNTFIGAVNQNNSAIDYFKGKIHYIQFYENDQLINDYRPYSSDSLIDIVNKNIITKLGSGITNISSSSYLIKK